MGFSSTPLVTNQNKHRQCTNLLCGCPIAEQGKPCPYCGAYDGEAIYPFEREYLDEIDRSRREAEQQRRYRRNRLTVIGVGAVFAIGVMLLIGSMIGESIRRGQADAYFTLMAAARITDTYIYESAPTLTISEAVSSTDAVNSAPIALSDTGATVSLLESGGTFYGIDSSSNAYFVLSRERYSPLLVLSVNAAAVTRWAVSPAAGERWIAIQANTGESRNATFYNTTTYNSTSTDLAAAASRGIVDLEWSPNGTAFAAIVNPAGSGDRTLLIVPFDPTTGTTPPIQSPDNPGAGITLVTRDQIAAVDYFPDGSIVAFIVGKSTICPGWCLQYYTVPSQGLSVPVELISADSAAELGILRLQVSLEGDRIAFTARNTTTGVEALYVLEFQPRRTLYFVSNVGINSPLVWLPNGRLVIRSEQNALNVIDLPRRQVSRTTELSSVSVGFLDWTQQ